MILKGFILEILFQKVCLINSKNGRHLRVSPEVCNLRVTKPLKIQIITVP